MSAVLEKQEDRIPDKDAGQQTLTVDRIKTKQITVGVIGLGYVGFPLSLVFAEAGVRVLGFDVDSEKVNALENRQSYIKHIDPKRLKTVRDNQLFKATNKFSEVASCDIVIICVPTPLDHHLEPDLKYVVDTCKSIAPYLKPNALVSLESTTWPGTTDEVMRPILEMDGKKKILLAVF